MLPTRSSALQEAALQEAALQEALEHERVRMAAFLDDSAGVVQPAHAPWTVPCSLDLEVQPRASFSDIEEELRHLELDLVEAIEGYKEHVHELHFWRFGPPDEVEAERRFIAEMLQEEQAHRTRSGARGALGKLCDDDGESEIRDGMKRCRRRLQLELRVAELELQLRLQTHRGTNEEGLSQERGQRGACIPGPLNIKRDRSQKDRNWVHAGCLETSEATDGDGRPAIVGHANVAVSVLPDGFMKELESTINALHAELEGRDREVQRLQQLVDEYGRNLLSIQSDTEPRSSLKRRNKLLSGSVASWRNRVRRHRNAIHCEHRLELIQKARIVQSWHNHVLMQAALRKIRLDDGITLKGSVMNRQRSLLEVWRRVKLQRVLQMWVAQPGLRGSKLALKLMRQRLRQIIHMWISGACMMQERQIRIAQCQNKAARRTVIQILRFWRVVVDKGESLAHCHNRFASRSSTKKKRSYFLLWFYRKMHLKFNRLNHLRLQVRSRSRRLKAIFFGWSMIRSREQFQRRAVVRIQVKSSFRGMSTAMQSWRREYMNRQSKAKRAELRQRIWQTRNVFAFWSEFVCLAQAKRRLNIEDGLFIRGSLENRLRLHLRATRRRHLIQLILAKWVSLPALCCRGFARKAIKNRLKSIFVLWIRRVFFFQNRQLCVVRFQSKTSRKKLNRILQAWCNAVEDAKRLARQHSLIHLRSRYRTLSNVMQSWRPAVHYLIVAQQYLRLASEMGEGTGSATAHRSSRDGKSAVMCLAAWREAAGSCRMLRERCKQAMARRKRTSSREFFHRWAQAWGSRRRQLQNAVACLRKNLRSHAKHKKDVLRTWACFVQVQVQMRVAMVRVERKNLLLLLMGIMATWADVVKKALQERRRMLKKHIDIGARLSTCHQDDDPFHFVRRRIFGMWRKRVSFEEHIHTSILRRKRAQRINSILRVWKELCMYVSWKRTMASLVTRALKASHMRRKRIVFSSWVHEHARIKQDRACSELISRTLYANSKSLNAVTGLNRSSVFFSWSSHAVQMNKVRRHSKRMLLKLRLGTLSNVMQSWRPAVHYLIAAQQYLRLASEMGEGTGSATAHRSSRDGKSAVMCLAAWREAAGSCRMLRERCKQTMARRKRTSSREFFHRWAQAWGSRRRQLQNAVACLRKNLRSHAKHKKDVLRTWACFVQVQVQMRVAMVRVERKNLLLLLMGIMATWADVVKKALQERRRMLKKHIDIGARLSTCHQDDDPFHFVRRRIFGMWRKRVSFEEHIHTSILRRKRAQRINSILRVWKELCMYVSWKRTMASLVTRALKASHMRRKRIMFSSWVHEHARIKQDRACSELISRTLYANSKSLNAVTGLNRSSVFFSWSSHAVQMNKVRRHSKRMLLKLRLGTLSNVMQSWRPAVHYLIVAQQYLRLASEMGEGSGSATAHRSSRDGKSAVMCLAAWREAAGSCRMLRERCKQAMARRKRTSSREFFHRWAQAWGSRRRQLQNAVACLRKNLRSHAKHKKDVLRTWACFVQVQVQMRVAMVRVERKNLLLLLMGIMATWADVVKKALQERRRMLKKHIDIGARLSTCHQDDDPFHFVRRRIFGMWRKRVSFEEHIHTSILRRKRAQRINSILRVWKELCMYVSWKRTMASLVTRALKASHMRRKRIVFSSWVHEHARIKQDRACSELISRTLYANSKSLNAVTGLNRSSVFFSWSSHAVQMNKVRRHSKRMLLKLRLGTLSNVMQSWRPAVHYLIAAQQYLRLASEMGEGTGSATAHRSSRDGKSAVMCLAAWREAAGSCRMLRERCKQTMARRKRTSSREFFHRWAQAWGSRRRQLQNAVACLRKNLRSHAKHKKDVLRTWACFVQVQVQIRVAMVRVERKNLLLLLMGIMATWADVVKKALQERRRMLKKHIDIGARLSTCHQDDDPFHFVRRRIFGLWRKRISKASGSKVVLRWQRRVFVAWSEYAARQRRAVKIVMRWINLLLSPAVSRWMAYVEEKKRLARSTHKVFLRWQSMCLALAWARWKEKTAGQRKLRVAGSKMVKRWTHKSQALAWGKWWEELRRSRVVKKAAVRWTQKILCAAWSTWGAQVTEGRRMRTIGAKVCVRWKQWTMSGAWMTWQCRHSETKRLAKAADKVVLRWQHMCLAPAWLRWVEHWRRKSKMMAIVSKLVLRWQRLWLWRGLMGWREHAARQRRMASAAIKIVRRWINLALSPAVSRWMAYVEEKKRLARATDKAMLRWQSMCLALAWARWKEKTAGQRKLRVAGSKMVKRWTHKSQALAWGKWGEDLRRSRVVKKAAVRWTQKILCAAWSTWAETCTESLWLRARSWKAWRDGRRRLMMKRGVSERIGLRIRNRILKTVWSVWLKRSCALKELKRLRGKMLKANLCSLLMNSFWGWSWLYWRQKKLTRCLKKKKNRDVCEKLTRVLRAWRATAVIRHLVHSRTNRKAIRLCRNAFIGWRDSVLFIHSNDIFVRQVIRRSIFAVCERFWVIWCRLYRLAKRIRGAVQRAVKKKLYHNAVQFFIVWRGRVFKKRLQLRVERVFVRKKTRQAACLVMATWLEMCEEQQSSGPFAITAVRNTAVVPKNSDSQPQVPRAIQKWSEGIMKMVNIHEMRQRHILKMWRSLKDEKDTSQDVVSRLGLMLLAKTLNPWRSLCSSRKLYRKSSVCVVETLTCHLALTGLHSMKRFLLVWFALTIYQGSKRRFVKWLLWRPHRKRTESYFWLWASTCFHAKMLERRMAKVCIRRGDMIRSRRQILQLFSRWQVAAHVMRLEKKRQRILYTRCKRLCRIKTLNVLCEWRSAILDSERKERQIFNSQRSLARTQIFKTVTHWSSIALFAISRRRRVSKAKRALQLVRISNLFQQWASFTLRDHGTRRLVSITKNRICISRTTNLVALLFSSWLSIIIQGKSREQKVARKIFWKAILVKRFVWHHLHSFCTGAKVTRKRVHARISRIRYRLVQKIFLVFVKFHKALLRAQHVRNEKCIAKNAAAWIFHVRCRKWRRCVGKTCSRRKTYRLLDSCFARWVHSLNVAHQNAELDALSASQWRMRIRARAFDQWRRSVELNIRWHAYLFSQIVPSYSSRCSRWTAIVSCFSTFKCWTLKRRHFRLLGRICSKTRRSSEMQKCRQSFSKLASYCKRRRILKRMVLSIRNRGIFKTYATWADNARELCRQKGVLDLMALRMRNAGILKAYATWADNARELGRQRSVLKWMALRIRKAGMFKAWCSWRKYASSRQRKRRLLLKASKCAHLNTAVFLDLVLDMHMSEITGNEQYFKDCIVRDVADSIGGHADLIHCVALEAGSIIVHLKLEEGVCGLKRRAQDVAKELMTQAVVPNSKFKGGHYTRTAKDVRVVSSSAAVQRNVLFYIVKLRVLQSWRTYVDHKSRDRIFIQQKNARALFRLSNYAFASWRTFQKEGRIQLLLIQIESIQLLHDRKSNAFNENVTKMCDSIESRLHALLQNQEQVLLGAVSLKQRYEIQHGEMARVLEKTSRVESEWRVAVAELESARNQRQGDIERIESELRSERTLLVAEFHDEKERLKEHRIDVFEARKGRERFLRMQEQVFSCLSYHTRQQSKLFRFQGWRRLRCMAQALHTFAFLSKQRHQEEMLEQMDSVVDVIREAVDEAWRMGRNLLEDRPQDLDTPRRKYQEIVPLPPREGRGLQSSGRRFFVREVEQRRTEESRPYKDVVSSARNLSLMILEVSERNRARIESRRSQDTAYTVLRQKNTRLVADIQQRSKRRHRMQQIVSNWHYWASYRQARALGHERVCARFQRQQAKGQKQRILDALSLGKISRLEMELDDVKSSFLCVQTRISSLKAQVSIKQAEPDPESNPERLRFEHEKIDSQGDVTEDGTSETLSSDAQHNLEEITLYLSHLRSLNTSLQDRINQQNFRLTEMRQKVQEASTLQAVHTFNENVTKMCDSIESRLHALLQNQEQVLLGAVSLKQRYEIQHGEMARVLEKTSRVESEWRVAVAELESARNQRQGDIERIESELRSERTLLVAEFHDEKERLKEHRIDVFEARKGRERFLRMQEQVFSCLSYHTRQQSKLFRFQGWRRLRCMAQALHTFAFLSKQRHQEEMLEQMDSVVDVIREAVDEAWRMGRNLLEDRPQDLDTPRRKYQEIVPLPPREGRGLQSSGRRFFVREVEQRRTEESRPYNDVVSSARNLSLMILEVSERNRARIESRRSQDTAYTVLRQKNTRLVADIQQRSKRRHRMQQIVSNWHYWASYRQARALGHERVCARFQRQQAKGQKQRILDALSLGKISRLEMELDDVKSSFLCVQTRISSLKAQVSIKQAEPDPESNPERLRFEHEKIDSQGDVTEDGTSETLSSDAQHNLEEITLYLSHLRSLNTSLQDRINQQNFRLTEMRQKVQEASTLQAVHTFNENVTKMCDSIESRLHALLQNQEQVLLGAVSLKQRYEIQHGEMARVLEKTSRVESEWRVAVAELESARNQRQGDIERIESELRSERTLLVAEFHDEKERLKEHRIDVFEARKGRERFLRMQEQVFSCLSYHTRQQSKLFRFQGWRRLRCMAQALHTFAFLSKQRHQEEMLEQMDSVVDVIREAVDEAWRMGRNLLEDRPQDLDTPRRKYQEIVPLPPREGRGLQSSGRRFFVREVEQRRTEESRPYNDVVSSARNLSLMILEVSERNRARIESRRSQDTAYTVLRQKNTRLVADIQQRSKRRHRMQQIVSNWHYWASYRQARALGHERVCARFQRQQAKGQEMRAWQAFAEFCFHAKLQRADDVLVELRQQKQILLTAHDKHVVELQARNTRILTLEETALSQTKIIEDVRRYALDVGTAHDKDVIELQECKEVSTRQTHLIADLQRQFKDAQDFDESQSQSIQNLEQVSASLAQVIENLNRQVQDAHEIWGKAHYVLQDKLEGTSRELQHALSANASLRGIEVQLKAEHSALKNECTRLRSYENSIATIRIRVDDLQTREDDACKQILSMQTTQRVLEGKLAASQKSLLQAQQMLQQSEDAAGTIAAEKIELEVVVKTLTASLLAFQSKCHESMEKLRFHNADLHERLVATELLSQTLFCDLDDVRMDLYHFTTYETGAAKLEEENNDLRSSIDAMNGTLKDLNIATIDQALRRSLEQFLSVRGRVMTLEAEKQTLMRECIRLRSTESSLSTFRSRVNEMQLREEAGQRNLLSLQVEKRNAERRLAEANESIRKSDNMLKHLTQDKVDLESELEALRIVNANLRHELVRNKLLHTQEHFSTLQSSHENVIATKSTLPDDGDQLDKLSQALQITVKEKSTLPDDEITYDKAGDEVVDEAVFPCSRQSDIDRGKMLTAVGELRNSLSARATRSRPFTPRLRPASMEAGPEAEGARVAEQTDVEKDKKRAIQAAIKLRAFLSSK